MKILILHGENTYNYGTFMMLINYIYYNNKYSKNNLKYYVRVTSDLDFERLKKELPSNIKIVRFVYKKENESLGFVKKLLGLKYKFFDQIRQIKEEGFDKVIILGGDDLSEYYKKWLIFTDLLLLIKLSKFSKIELIGQTVGPFYSWRKILAKKLFNKSKLILRDKECATYLKNKLNFHNFKISNDLAFLELPFEFERFYILIKYGLQNNNYITIVPSGLYEYYSSNFNNYIKNWIKIINSILEIKELEKYNLVFLGHVLKPTKIDDRRIILEIKNKVKSPRCKFILDEMLPTEAKTIFKNSFFIITGRMHPAISAFSCNKLAISLSYSVKYKGVIGRQLRLPELIIEKDDYWNNFLINIQIKEKILALLNNNKIKNFNIISDLKKIKNDIINSIFLN